MRGMGEHLLQTGLPLLGWAAAGDCCPCPSRKYRGGLGWRRHAGQRSSSATDQPLRSAAGLRRPCTLPKLLPRPRTARRCEVQLPSLNPGPQIVHHASTVHYHVEGVGVTRLRASTQARHRATKALTSPGSGFKIQGAGCRVQPGQTWRTGCCRSPGPPARGGTPGRSGSLR